MIKGLKRIGKNQYCYTGQSKKRMNKVIKENPEKKIIGKCE